MKRISLIIAILAVIALPWTSALAFHDDGVADCAGCHTMHNSENGALIDPNSPGGNEYLLRDASASDVCLTCHGSSTSRGVWGTSPTTPLNQHGGGDFIFLTEDNVNDGHGGASSPIPGRAAGHNVIAPSKSSGVDPVLAQAPGGTYPSAALGCTSCHDPHGNMNFRLLYGAGHVEAGNWNFANAAPVAQGITLSSSAVESNTNHTAYQSGMSAWCANCHGDYHANNTDLVHPSGENLGGSVAQTYNLYNGTANQTGGNPATAYLAAVPFEDPTAATNSTAGPTASSKVSCISCHRAHASSAANIGRWDFQVTFLDEDGVESGSYRIPDPYNNVNQRSLCNKCHNKDAGDGNPN